LRFKGILACLVIVVLVGGCKDKAKVDKVEGQKNVAGNTASGGGALHSGIVSTTMDSGGYTYIEVEESGEKYWVAAPKFKVTVGERVNFSDGAWIENFKSKTLDRTFDKILFISGTAQTGAPGDAKMPASQAGHKMGGKYDIPKSLTSQAPTVGSISKAEGGYTVEELFSKKADLNGKVVKVRGKVVKVSRNIMGKNWIHLQDGTGSKGTNDVTFTSKTGIMDVGSVILAEGTLAAGKDFGAGYLYSVIVENSTFSK